MPLSKLIVPQGSAEIYVTFENSECMTGTSQEEKRSANRDMRVPAELKGNIEPW